MSGTRRILCLAALTCVSAASAGGQAAAHGPSSSTAAVFTSTPFELRNRSASALLGESGKTATAVFSVKNLRKSPVRVIPEITVPDGWRVVLGSPAFVVGPENVEIWTIAFQIPGHAKAGRYTVPVLARTDADVSMKDSVLVTVGERYHLEAAVAERASYVMAGEAYSTRFVVRNRGNTDVTVQLKAINSGDSRISGATVIAIPAGGATTVTVVSKVSKAQINGSDVTELTTIHAGSGTEVRASAAVAVIEPSASWLAGVSTVPGALKIRASTGARRVSPFELGAGGAVGASGHLEFLVRTPAGVAAISGERDEYRLGWRNHSKSITLGDHYTHVSPLTSSGGEGFGASATAARGRVNLGVYSLRARRPGTRGSEQGAILGLSHRAGTVALNVVSRTGPIAGQVSSLSATVPFAGEGKVELEYAVGRDSAAFSAAHRLRLSGRIAGARYEFATQAAEREFAGPQRGGSYGYGSVSMPVGALTTRIYANQYGNEAATASVSALSSRTTAQGVALESPFGISLDLFRASRVQEVSGTRRRTGQDAARIFVARSSGRLSLLSTVSAGRNAEPTPSGANFFKEFSISPQLQIRGQSVGVSYSFSDGNSAHGNGTPLSNVGLNANLALPRRTTLHLSGSGWRPAASIDEWGVLGQARLGHVLANGATVTLAGQATGGLRGSATDGATSHTVYVEYSTPIRLPVGRSRAPGQARGVVVDQQGRPVAGALVWVGDRASVTNNAGSAYFARLRPGSHAVVVGSRGAGTSAEMGRVALHVDSASRTAATFKVAIGKGGRIRVSVSNFAADPTVLRAREARDGAAEPLPGLVVMLTGRGDTLYQTTDDRGYADFGTVGEGAWTATVLGEVPPFTRWEESRIEITVRAGAAAEPEFRLVRRERNVRAVATLGGDDQPMTTTLRLSAVAADESGRP